MALGPVQGTNKQQTNLEQIIKLFAPMGDRMMGESPFAGPGAVLGDPNAVENWYPEGRAQPVPSAVFPPPSPSPGVSSGILRSENAGTPPSGYGTASNSVVPGQSEPSPVPTRPTRSAFFSGVPEFEPQPIFNAPTRNLGSENKRTLEASGIAALLSLIAGQGQSSC